MHGIDMPKPHITRPRYVSPVGAVIVTLLLGAALLAVLIDRKKPESKPPLVDDGGLRILRASEPASGRRANAGERQGRSAGAGRPAAKLTPKALDYTRPEGSSWHRAMLEKSPEEWSRAHGRNLPVDARAEMLDYFRHTTNLPVRVELAEVMMAQMVDDDLVLAVAHAVTNDYRLETLSGDDASSLLDLFSTLRFATTTSATAFALAVQGAEFEFWDQHRPFLKALDEDGQEDRSVLATFPGEAIQAIGFAENPQVPALLAGLRARDINYTYYMRDSLVDAAYRQDLLTRKKEPGFKLSGRSVFDDFSNWERSTANGKDWGSWANELGKQRPTIKRD